MLVGRKRPIVRTRKAEQSLQLRNAIRMGHLPGEEKDNCVFRTTVGSCSAHLGFLTWTGVRRRGNGTAVGTAVAMTRPM